MINQVQIVSWLLTRVCNLKCSYCAISRNYDGKPKEYPDLSHYAKNQMSTEYVIESLRRFKEHNSNCFHIFYGGEPMLRKDLADIINFCNDQDIDYTIITNNSDKVQPLIEDLLQKTDYIQGFTSSVDPNIYNAETFDVNEDRIQKSLDGIKRLVSYGEYIKDVVAEITVDNTSILHLPTLVQNLTDLGVNSDVTFIDIAKNSYYDFSNVTDDTLLLHNTDLVQKQIFKLKNLNIHMFDMLTQCLTILPSDLNCHIERNLHNLTIDADGTVRLCLRIRGVETPSGDILSYMDKNGIFSSELQLTLSIDKKKYCQGCNWTCIIMSERLSEGEDDVEFLVHDNIREDEGD